MDFGYLFDGKYRIIKSLGSGGSGHVYLAENVRVGNLWAIKEIAVGKENSTTVELEIEVLRKIRHPALPRIADVIREDNRIYIVEDYIEGRTASEFIEDSLLGRGGGGGHGGCSGERENSGNSAEGVRGHCGGWGVDGRIALEWALKICDIMQFLHRQQPSPIIYRDLKPSNIIITPEGGICLVDFGSVRLYKAGGVSDTVYIGTRGYAAPEQYGMGQTSVRTDVYSFGMTMLHILSGSVPTVQTIWTDITELGIIGIDRSVAVVIWRILQKCTMTREEDRYSDFGEVKSDIENAIKRAGEKALGWAGEKASGWAGEKAPEPVQEKTPMWASDGSPVQREAAVGSVRMDGGLSAGLCRCLTMSIVKNHEFAYELASCASSRHGRRVLIIDLDIETSLTAWYFHRNRQNRMAEPSSGAGSGLLGAIDIAARVDGSNDERTLTGSGGLSGLAEQSLIDPKLYLLYERNQGGAVSVKDRLVSDGGKILWRILCELTTRVDLCLLLTGESVYSNLNLLCFRNSHYIVCPDRADIPSVLAFNNRAALAGRLGGVPAGRIKYVIWELRLGEGMAACEGALFELPEQTLAGSVRHSKKRDASRNDNSISERKCYASCMEKAVINEYNDIIRAFQINEIS